MQYRGEIDGLRALAVLPVILFHADFSPFGGGYVGVDVFFVISGYLITSIILDELTRGEFSIVGFYERRARRILPALFFVMAVCLPAAWFWMYPNQMNGFSQSLIAVGLFVSNILFWRESGYFATEAEFKPLLHTWSLAVEEQYYVLFPVFLILTWWFGRSQVFWIILALAVSSLALCEWASRNVATANFYLAPTRAWELLAGSLVAFHLFGREVKGNNLLSLLGLCLIVFAIFAFDETTRFPSLYAVVPVLGTVLIILCAGSETWAGRFLNLKVCVGIGLVSYSAYLWHQPLFAFARIDRGGHPGPEVMGALAVLSVVLAIFSWKFVEAPFRNRKRVSRRQIFLFSGIGTAFFLAFGIAGMLSDGYKFRFSDQVNGFLDLNMRVFEERVAPCWTVLDDVGDVSSACALGADGEEPTFILFGDSHAGALQNELSVEAGKAGLSGLGASYRSCPPLQSAVLLGGEDGTDQICARIRDSFFALDTLPEIVVVSSRWALLIEKKRYTNDAGHKEGGVPWVWKLDAASGATYADRMAAEITASLDAIVESGRKLVIVYPVPELGWSIPGHLAGLALDDDISETSGAVSYESFTDRNRRAYAALDAVGPSEAVRRVYPADRFCDPVQEKLCFALMGDQVLYFDDDHLSPYASNLVARDIVTAIEGLMAGE